MNRFALLVSFVVAGAMLGGCPETARCPEGQVRQDRRCVDADGGDDGGEPDAGEIADAGPDGGPCGECGDTTPFCVVDRDGGAACSECDPGVGNDSCGRFTDRPICDRDTARCVECTADADCTSPGASRCVDHECVPCEANSHCDHVMSDTGDTLGICDTSGPPGTNRCVECTIATERDDCGSFVCNPETLRCADGRVREIAGTCSPCISDSECVPGLFCVPMQFMGVEREDRYCLRPVDAVMPCPAPYGSLAAARPSASGRAPGDYCAPNEALTTCEAVLAVTANRSCDPAADPDERPCMGAGGSSCGRIGSLPNGCTYRCSANNQCPVLGAGSGCSDTTQLCE